MYQSASMFLEYSVPVQSNHNESPAQIQNALPESQHLEDRKAAQG